MYALQKSEVHTTMSVTKLAFAQRNMKFSQKVVRKYDQSDINSFSLVSEVRLPLDQYPRN
jgi:flagellar basal body rod protein FlgG